MRQWRKTHRLAGDALLRARARSYANVYRRRGKLIPKPCPCGSTDVEMHHRDYTKPLDVLWRCKSCHGAEHGISRTCDHPPVPARHLPTMDPRDQLARELQDVLHDLYGEALTKVMGVEAWRIMGDHVAHELLRRTPQRLWLDLGGQLQLLPDVPTHNPDQLEHQPSPAES